MTQDTINRERAIDLLAQDLPQNIVANALGISDSRISQYLSEQEFVDAVAARKIANYQKHTEHDNALDRIESKVAEKLEKLLPLMTTPGMVLRTFQVINQARRRTASSNSQMSPTVINQQFVSLTMPEVAVSKFRKDAYNQIIEIEDSTNQSPKTHSLVTIQASMLPKLAKEAVLREVENENARTSTVQIGP